MANPIWSLSNKTIDNRGTKVNPKLTTVTSSNTGGWETLRNGSTIQYRIDAQGNVGYRDDENGKQYANLQQFADEMSGEYSTSFIQKYINRIKNDITGVLQTRTQNTIPSQPPPAAPGAQSGTDSGPTKSTEAGTTIGSGGLEQFKNDAFGTNKFKSNNLTYPSTMDSSQDRLFISQLEYVRTGVIQNESDFTKLKSIGSVTLPMPNNISESNAVGWGEDSLSNIAAAVMPDLAALGGSLSEGGFVEAATAGVNIVNKLQSNAISERARQFLTTKFAAGVVGKFGINVNPEAYITRATGAAINPNLELLFQGPRLRAFGLAFKMTPRSSDEAAEIRKILRFFKKGMSPRRASDINSEAGFFLGTPNVFKVDFKSGGNTLKSIGQFKTCALVSFTANYTPDGFYAAYNDGAAGGSQPIAVTMQMGFSELTPVFSDEFNDTEDDVGPNNFKYETKIPNVSAPNTTQLLTQEQLADREGIVPTIPQRPTVSGGSKRAESFGAGISNIERYEAAKAKGFSGTFQEFLNTQR